MVVKVVATPCLQWSQPSSASKRAGNDVVSVGRNPLLGTTTSKLNKFHSAEFGTHRRNSRCNVRRACSAGFDEFSDAEFSRESHELARRLQFAGAGENSDVEHSSSMESKSPEILPEPLDLSASIEMRANSVGLPVFMRMIKRKKKQWEEDFINGVGESAYCSVKKAFSSMVFIIRELHSFTLQMRELWYYEDMQGILERVRREIHASFVWLFQQVFSHTPALMVHVMILLANFAVHSTSSATAITASAPPPAAEERETSTSGNSESSSIVKSCSASSSTTTSVGGGNGGGSMKRPAPTGEEGDGSITGPKNLHRLISPETVLHSPSTKLEEDEEVVVALWNSMVEEASRMLGEGRDEALLDHETMQRFVSPVMAKIDTGGNHEEYYRTELLYQTALSQDPNNVLLLANYAQFLYSVAHDYDRAEEYFKRAISVEPKDAEAHSKYANFLWQVRNDLWAAEETFLEAISADPSNSFYAANYAHFLWSTGGEDTCFPLDDCDNIDV